MSAFLLKRDGHTIAGLTAHEVDHAVLGTMSLAGRGVFVSRQAADQARNDAMTGRLDRYELSFEDGRRFAGDFRITNLRKGSVYAGEQMFDVTLSTFKPVEMM